VLESSFKETTSIGDRVAVTDISQLSYMMSSPTVENVIRHFLYKIRSSDDCNVFDSFSSYVTALMNNTNLDEASIWTESLLESMMQIVGADKMTAQSSSAINPMYGSLRDTIILMGWCFSMTDQLSGLKYTPHYLMNLSECIHLSSNERTRLLEFWKAIFRWWHAVEMYIKHDDSDYALYRERARQFLLLRSNYPQEYLLFSDALADSLQNLS
jgi:hypothetical protein